MTWTNLHTHTWRCQHASGEVIDYAQVARAGGMQVLGMSDHAPLPDGRWEDHRMAMAQLDDYISAVTMARQEVPEVRILLGLECDWDPGFAEFYTDLRANRGFDYLIAGCHFTPFPGGEYMVPGARISAWIDTFNTCNTVARLQAYARHAAATMASGHFAFLTHPDLFAVANPQWTADTAACARDICQAAVALGVPLELNSYGLRKPWVRGADGDRPGYPWPPFWEVAAATGVQVVLSSDAHRPQDVFAGHAELVALRERLGLVEAEFPWAAARVGA